MWYWTTCLWKLHIAGMIDDDPGLGPIPSEIGDRLYATRTALELTQAAFAERLGLSQPTYALYETGKRMLPPRWAVAIAVHCRVTTDWLYLGDASGIPYKLHDAIMAAVDERKAR